MRIRRLASRDGLILTSIGPCVAHVVQYGAVKKQRSLSYVVNDRTQALSPKFIDRRSVERNHSCPRDDQTRQHIYQGRLSRTRSPRNGGDLSSRDRQTRPRKSWRIRVAMLEANIKEFNTRLKGFRWTPAGID